MYLITLQFILIKSKITYLLTNNSLQQYRVALGSNEIHFFINSISSFKVGPKSFIDSIFFYIA